MQSGVGSTGQHSSPVSAPPSEHLEHSESPNRSRGSESKVAVIAIHGVGQHAPGASAEAVSTLLMMLPENGNDVSRKQPLYPGFVSTSIDVPLRPVQSPSDNAQIANQRNQQKLRERIIGIFDERRGFLAQVRKNADYDPPGYRRNELRPNEPDRGEYGYQFMLTQLAGYQGEVDRDFQTIRLEGKRKCDSTSHPVDIYDAHYSDLTKPQSNILAFFFAFYQLLFHLASLSLMAVYWAEAENRKADRTRQGRWRVESSIHATSVRFLTMFVPILNVVLLELGCCAFVDKLHGTALTVSSLTVAAILGLVATFLLLRNRNSPQRPFLWGMVPFLGAGIGMLVLGGLARLYNSTLDFNLNLYSTLLLCDWLLIAGILLALVAKKFDQLRPGAYPLSILLYLINICLFLFHLLPLTSQVEGNHVATASLWAVRWIFGELLASWIICLGSALLSWPLSSLCIHGIKHDQARKARAIAAFRTGRFAFAVPAILFVIATCALWSGILVYGSYKLEAFDRAACDPAGQSASTVPLPSFLVPRAKPVEEWIGRVKDPSLPVLQCRPVRQGHPIFGTPI